MSKFIINGGKALSGTISVSGNKNSIFPLVAVSILANSPTTLTNVPRLRDVDILIQIFKELGGKCDFTDQNTLNIDPSGISSYELSPELVGRLRGAIVLAAALLLKFGKASMPRPGGDSIGKRPLDAHLAMFREFGARCETNHSGSVMTNTGGLKSAKVTLEEPSVTATEMALIVAAGLPGETIIEDAASEPHVIDLAEILIKMGAEITGAGSSIITVTGKKELKGVNHKIRPDHTEVGTFAVAAGVTGGEVLINGIVQEDLKKTLLFYSKLGLEWEFAGDTSLRIMPSKLKAKAKVFKTRPWPGFPTDLVSPLIVLATQTEGTVLIHDWMYEGRMYFVDYLIKMGANITLADPHRAIVVGPTPLFGETIPSPDIRAGGALVLAALSAQGGSIVEHAEIIDRGYESFDKKLQSLGADIRREE